MNFKFSNLLGASYRGGNLLIQGQELYSAVGNRVSVVRPFQRNTLYSSSLLNLSEETKHLYL
jgi:periodic tryptophan protein 2